MNAVVLRCRRCCYERAQSVAVYLQVLMLCVLLAYVYSDMLWCYSLSLHLRAVNSCYDYDYCAREHDSHARALLLR